MANDKFTTGRVEKGTTEPNVQGVIWIDDNTGDVKLQTNATGHATPAYETLGGGGGGSNHDLLDGSVAQDTLAGTVVRGDIIVGNSTPKWARLAKGNSGDLLQMGANDPAWVAVPTATAHNLLSATHSDTTTATVARGRWIMGKGSSPTWQMMGPRARVLPYLGNRYPLLFLAHGYDQALTTYAQIFSATAGTPTVTGLAVVPSASGEQYGRFNATLTNNIIHRTSGQEVLPTMYPYMWSYCRVTDNVDGAMFIGFNSLQTPANTTTETANSAYFWCRNGTHTNWQAVTKNGTTPNTQDTTIALDGNFHLFEVVSNDGGTTWLFFIDGTQRASSASNVPVTSTILYTHFGTCINISSSTRTVDYKSAGVACGDPALALNWGDIEQAGHL